MDAAELLKENLRLKVELALLMLALSDNECPEESPTTIEEALEVINVLREKADYR